MQADKTTGCTCNDETTRACPVHSPLKYKQSDPPTPPPSISQSVYDPNRSNKTATLNGRVPVDYDYNGLEPEFLHMMAQITAYADKKYAIYGGWTNYKKARLEGEKSPINHIYAHLGNYREKVPYDHFNGNHIWHLVAIAYNAMMEFWYEVHGQSS